MIATRFAIYNTGPVPTEAIVFPVEEPVNLFDRLAGFQAWLKGEATNLPRDGWTVNAELLVYRWRNERKRWCLVLTGLSATTNLDDLDEACSKVFSVLARLHVSELDAVRLS